MTNSTRIASICLIGCLYVTAGLADDKKAIWGTDGQALTQTKPSAKTLNPKISQQAIQDMTKVSIKTPTTDPRVMSGMGGMAGKTTEADPK